MPEEKPKAIILVFQVYLHFKFKRFASTRLLMGNDIFIT